MKPERALKPDAQPFDEVRIKTVPRYKTSEFSGDEWRISASIEFLRKGKVVHESSCRNVEVACGLVMAEYYKACDDGKGHFEGEENLCDQEGCSESATVTYRLKREYSRDRPHEWNMAIDDLRVRKFCKKHEKRGDAAFDDSDENYELLSPILAGAYPISPPATFG